MPLPRYQPVKKRAKIVAGATINDLDDNCLSRIIAYALGQSKSRTEEPYVGDNRRTERSLSLVSKRWYFLVQTQVSDHGVHKIDLDQALVRANTKTMLAKYSATGGMISMNKTPRRIGLHASAALTSYTARTPAGGPTARKRLPYGVLSQKNLTVTNGGQQTTQDLADDSLVSSYDIKLFREVYPKLLKYKHVQLSGSISLENFDKLLIGLNAARVERLDLLKVRIEDAKFYSEQLGKRTLNDLAHIQTLTYTWSNHCINDATNGLLWTIYERAVNLRELQVYLIDDYNNMPKLASQSGANNDSHRSNDSAQSAPSISQSAICDFNGKLSAPVFCRRHPNLAKVVFDRLLPPNMEPSQYIPVINCDYSILVRRVLSHEPSIQAVDTNDCSLIDYLIQASDRVCTKHQIRSLRFTHPIKGLDMIQKLIKLQNLGSNYLAIVVDEIDMISDLKAALENYTALRKNQARCELNLYIKDQKFPDNEEKVKHLISLCRIVDVNVYISALQRVSIDCCHLMWSTGRALQAANNESAGRCIFKISLQTYPIKPNTVNPCEITIPFGGKCPQYTISSTREDIVRHREIMKSLKRDCYHQFVKSVRDNGA